VSGRRGTEVWKESARLWARRVLAPVAGTLARAGVSPDLLTWGGVALTAAGAYCYARGWFLAGTAWAVAGSLLDALDGAVARDQGRESRFGAFLDSTLDRVSDTLLFTGIAAYYFFLPVVTSSSVSRVFESKFLGQEPVNDFLVGLSAIVALAGSYLVSYTRARAEGLGVECRVGWFERPERLLLLLGAAAFGRGPLLEWALVLLAVLTWITVVQRIVHVRGRLQAPRGAGRE
jgi:CDP-diacylglycerol--glycerol-3-phosphate 3-phosphatidyltransferase